MPDVGNALGAGVKGLAVYMGKRMLSTATDKVGATTERLTDYVSNGGGPGLMNALTGRGGEQKSGKDKSLKVTNIVEHIDVGVPRRIAYDQWTRFADFPSFMKKVESVEQEADEKLTWKAQVLWSHRTWEATITEQVPDQRIVWTSEGQKGSVDGAVTFHELGPELTRIILVLQYHPQGFFERTGNMWRAQGRRARLELKHFARHVMTEAVLHPDELEGWRGEIRESEVVKDNEAAQAEERQDAESGAPADEPHAGRGDGGRPSGRSERGRDGDERDRGSRPESRSGEERPGRPVRRGDPGRRPARQARGQQ